MKNQNSRQMFCKSPYNVSLLLLKIEHSFLQESIDNNKSIGVTIYRCQIQAIIKKCKTFDVFKLIYFKKFPIKKVLIKLRVLSDTSVLIKCWFYKQTPQKVLIELNPGVSGHFHKLLCEEIIFPLQKGKNDGLRYEVSIQSSILMGMVISY